MGRVWGNPIYIVDHISIDIQHKNRTIHLFKSWFAADVATAMCNASMHVGPGNVMYEPTSKERHCERCFSLR